MTRLLILTCVLAIVLSLGSALVHLVRDKGESEKMARALTIRVGLSVLLFAAADRRVAGSGLDPAARRA